MKTSDTATRNPQPATRNPQPAKRNAMNAFEFDNFFEAYVSCALWSSTDDDGDPLEYVYFVDDIAPETLAAMERECRAFLDYLNDIGADFSEWTPDQLGHDFWLSRNGHGAGFFDRGHALGRVLHEAAKTFGTYDLYVGDSGRVYGI